MLTKLFCTSAPSTLKPSPISPQSVQRSSQTVEPRLDLHRLLPLNRLHVPLHSAPSQWNAIFAVLHALVVVLPLLWSVRAAGFAMSILIQPVHLAAARVRSHPSQLSLPPTLLPRRARRTEQSRWCAALFGNFACSTAMHFHCNRHLVDG
jgi:hypothetical protein